MKLTLLTVTTLLLAPLATLPASEKPAGKPNIVFLLIDDLGFAGCGFNGGKDILAPNIDRLAAAGAIIDSHYVQPVYSIGGVVF